MTSVPITRSGCWIPFGPDSVPASAVGATGGGSPMSPGGSKQRRGTFSSASGGPFKDAGHNISSHYASAANNASQTSRYLRKTLVYRDLPWDLNFYDCIVSPAPYGGPVAALQRGSTVIEVYTAAGKYLTEFPIPSMLNSPNLSGNATTSAASRLQSKSTVVSMGWSSEESLMVLTDSGNVYFYRLGMSTAGCAMAELGHIQNRLSRPTAASSPFLLVGCDEPPISIIEEGDSFDLCFAMIGPWGVVIQDEQFRLRGLAVAERKDPKVFNVDLSPYISTDITALDVIPSGGSMDDLAFLIAPGKGDRKANKGSNGGGTVLLVSAFEETVTNLHLSIPGGVCQIRCDKAGERIALYSFEGDLYITNPTLEVVVFKYTVGIPRRPQAFYWVGPDVMLLQYSMGDFEFSDPNDMQDEGEEGGRGPTNNGGYDEGPTDDLTILICVNKDVHAATRKIADRLDEVALSPTIINTVVVAPSPSRRLATSDEGSAPRARDGSRLDRQMSMFGGGPAGSSGKELEFRFGFPQKSDTGHIFHYWRWESEGGLCKIVPEVDGVRLITERNAYVVEWVPQYVADVQKAPSLASLIGTIGLNSSNSAHALPILASAASAAGIGSASQQAAPTSAAPSGMPSTSADMAAVSLPPQFLPLPARLVNHYHEYIVNNSVDGLTQAKALVAGLQSDEAFGDLLGTILGTALFEWDVDVQDRLLRVVAFAISQCSVNSAQFKTLKGVPGGKGGAAEPTDGSAPLINHSERYLDQVKRLRVINALRHADSGIPISIRQYEELIGHSRLTAQVIVDRLVSRHQFQLAISVANIMKIKVQPIYVRWSCIKVLAADAVSDADIRKQLALVMRYAPGATLTDTAMTAFRMQRPTLGVQLLDDDPKPHSKVMLFMKINNNTIALERACEAEDSDLVFLVLLKMLYVAQSRQQQLQTAAQQKLGTNNAGPCDGYFHDDLDPSQQHSSNSPMVHHDNSAYDGVVNALVVNGGAPLRSLQVLSRAVGKWEGIVAKFRREKGQASWGGYRLLARLLMGDDDVYYSGGDPGAYNLVSNSSPALSPGDNQRHSDTDSLKSTDDDNAKDYDEFDDDIDDEERERRFEAAVAKRRRKKEREAKRKERDEKKKKGAGWLSGFKDKDKEKEKDRPSSKPTFVPQAISSSPEERTIRLNVGSYEYLSNDQISSVIAKLTTAGGGQASVQAASDANYLRLHNSLLAEQEKIVADFGDSANIRIEDFSSLSLLGTIGFCLEKGLEQKATELKSKFNVKDAPFWHTKIRALVKSHRYSELDVFGKANDPKFTKSPVGWLPFIDALNSVGGLEDRMVPYIDKLPSTVAKVTWFASIRRYGKAADAAFKDDEVGMLQELLRYNDMDRATRDYIQHYVKELS